MTDAQIQAKAIIAAALIQSRAIDPEDGGVTQQGHQRASWPTCAS